jgi:6-phosphogluconolactonase
MRRAVFAVRCAVCVVALLCVSVVFCNSLVAQETKSGKGDGSLRNASICYVGTYTNTSAKSQGIYLFKLQGSQQQEVSQNVMLAPLGLAAETENPSYLVIDAKRPLLFCVNETSNFGGKPAGAVSSFSIDRDTGKLTLINQQSSLGTDPCHLTLDQTGKFLLAANYSSGSVVVIPVDENGKLGEKTDFVQHTGSGVNKQRQEGPHAHCVTMSPDNKFAFVCDLGIDKVMIYKFDAKNGKLTPNDPASVSLKSGAGPRHMTFRPDGKFAYVINELDSTVTAYAYDPAKGSLKEIQTIGTLPGYYDGPNTTAEVTVHPSGKYLYASNRGHNSVTLFGIDPADGTLTYVEDQNTGGKTPRHFGIEPGAKHLAFANQDTNTLLLCRIDATNGRLKPSGVFSDCPAPVCVLFVAPPNKSAEATGPTAD